MLQYRDEAHSLCTCAIHSNCDCVEEGCVGSVVFDSGLSYLCSRNCLVTIAEVNGMGVRMFPLHRIQINEELIVIIIDALRSHFHYDSAMSVNERPGELWFNILLYVFVCVCNVPNNNISS